MATAIETRSLCKDYGEIRAVRGLDLQINEGEIFGLIGPDGAGKTSTFQILGGVMQPTSGEAVIYGRSAHNARDYVGYLTQTFSLYQDLSVWENLQYIGQLRRLSDRQIDERGSRYLEMFDMHRFRQRLAGRLSGGMKQKLALACALIAEPRVLLLDEPTTGVDPVSRREFWDTLAQLSVEGMTIVVATPYLDEAERCHRVALFYDGEARQVGTPTEIRSSLGLKRLEARTLQLGLAEDVLANIADIQDVQRYGDRLDVMVRDEQLGRRAVVEAFAQANLEVIEIRASAPTLENAFVAVLRDLKGESRSYPFPYTAEPARREDTAIGAQKLNRLFGDFHAVRDIDLQIKYGEIYGLLGANGAGKTTTIKMLCGLLEPSTGEVTLAGERKRLRSGEVRRRIGYMSQKFSLYDDLTIEENLEFFAGVYEVPRGERAIKKRWVLEFSGLAGMGHLLTGSLPGGWKQRVAFGAAVMHEPSVLFLDEPTSGVDPLARRDFWKVINSLADRGVAILVTTHYLEEAEQCNRLGFMVAGEMVAEGAPSSIKAAQEGQLIELYTDSPQQALHLLKTQMEHWRVSLFGDRLHVIVDEEKDIERLQQRLRAAHIAAEAVASNYSLEDIFIVVVEKARREAKLKATYE